MELNKELSSNKSMINNYNYNNSKNRKKLPKKSRQSSNNQNNKLKKNKNPLLFNPMKLLLRSLKHKSLKSKLWKKFNHQKVLNQYNLKK